MVEEERGGRGGSSAVVAGRRRRCAVELVFVVRGGITKRLECTPHDDWHAQ